MSERTTAILLIAVVALGAMTGVAAADGGLEVAVDDADGEPTVTVTENDTAVENATVVVSAVDAENESYAGAGEYETDANGTVGLPAAEEDVTVEVTAAAGNDTAATTVGLEAPDGLELEVDDTDEEPVVTVTNDDEAVANASVNVTTADGQNVTYAGEGEYLTDEDGTVELPAAEEDVTVDVTAAFDNETVSTTVDLTVEEDDEETEEKPFGQLVREFIQSLGDRDAGIGGAVSDFVTENNPGNAPDDAGASDEADDDTENETDAPGNGNAPDHAGPDGERGPPDHAGDDDDDDAEGDEEDADEAETEDDEEDEAEEDDAGEDDAEEDEAEEDEAEEDDGEEDDDAEEEDDDDDDEDDGEAGPPDHAGGPGGN